MGLGHPVQHCAMTHVTCGYSLVQYLSRMSHLNSPPPTHMLTWVVTHVTCGCPWAATDTTPCCSRSYTMLYPVNDTTHVNMWVAKKNTAPRCILSDMNHVSCNKFCILHKYSCTRYYIMLYPVNDTTHVTSNMWVAKKKKNPLICDKYCTILYPEWLERCQLQHILYAATNSRHEDMTPLWQIGEKKKKMKGLICGKLWNEMWHDWLESCRHVTWLGYCMVEYRYNM